jgi:isobutyryl-CoA mutase
MATASPSPTHDVLDPTTMSRPVRFVTATSLFDGHDAAINVMRRLLQAEGAETVHLGHNRSVRDIVRAAVQEDADAIAVSSYQGGHLEFFKYLVDMLRDSRAGHIKVFGGGGGTITLEEIAELEAYGVERIYHPSDGMRLGLVGMIGDVMARVRAALSAIPTVDSLPPFRSVSVEDERAVAKCLSAIEGHHVDVGGLSDLGQRQAPVVGVTGTGGAGKSSVVDELLLRFVHAWPEMRIAVLAVDPTRRRSGGALLGDRIRMNTLRSDRIFMRSLATRRQHAATSEALRHCVAFLRSVGFDLVIVETAGIGQSDSEIADLVDLSTYVMTSEYGAASQLEKIDMLDFADLVVLNKFDRQGAPDALRDVRKQWRRNHNAFAIADDAIPVCPTIASQFNDPGVTSMFEQLCRLLREKLQLPSEHWTPPSSPQATKTTPVSLIPPQRSRYLAEIAATIRQVEEDVQSQAEAAGRVQACWTALAEVGDPALPALLESYPADQSATQADGTLISLRHKYQAAIDALSEESRSLLVEWPARLQAIKSPEFTYSVRGASLSGANYVESLSHQQIPKIAPPTYRGWNDLLTFLHRENLPGAYPYTAGVYPYRRSGEDPIRMFAGEGTPDRTNRRFHYLAKGQAATRLSTAFDSVTLYGEDPHTRPDILGKVGNSGVSVATLDDMKRLYAGFDLTSPATSVSMTINGPAPMILAMFMNTAIDQAVEKHLRQDSERWRAAHATIAARLEPGTTRDLTSSADDNAPLGLSLLGLTGDELVTRDVYERIALETLQSVRGTVQADILKEDQAQNTCIFSTEFALRMMGDVQQFFVDTGVRNFYSVSVSGYHIAEAGANPVTQLAFTLANGFTLVEYYLSRGMQIDDFAPNLSFFFSNGMDAEYTVIGRVARRIWARAMRERYHASARSQMLKYHIQTSGRSLHAQEIQFNDIRTTLQALYALFDNCNSLHTNAYDEAVTTPTEDSVRRAVAIQLIINREFGLNVCENPWQGSFIVDALTDIVEQAVLREFDALSERGGVLGAMDTMYQRSRIQEESLQYERRKHDGSLQIIGVNTFVPTSSSEPHHVRELIRASDQEQRDQIAAVERFRASRNSLAEDGRHPGSLHRLQQVARQRENVFAALMETVKFHSLGQISAALYNVGGEYRRNM